MKSHTILLIEDDDATRTLIQEILEADDYIVIVSENTNLGLDLLKSSSPVPALILMDWWTPGMSAEEFIRSKTALGEPCSAIPTVLMTAASNTEDKAQAVGACATLKKPFEVEDLRKVILEALSGSKATSYSQSILSSSEVIDWSYLRELKEMTGSDVAVKKILEVFKATAGDLVDEAYVELKKGENQKAREIIHRLKSSCGSIGATKLVRCCTHFETQAINEELADLIEEIRLNLKLVLDEIYQFKS